MSALARIAAVLPPGNAPYPAPCPSTPDPTLRQVLGNARLAAAVEHGDWGRVDELLDVLLDHPTLGRRLAGRVIVRTGEALASTSEGTTP